MRPVPSKVTSPMSDKEDSADCHDDLGAVKKLDTLSRRVLEVCNASGEFMEYWGFRAIYGRVWTVLALRRQPMPQTEIAETLGVSRSNVSMSIAELTKYGLVRATADHRNAPYEAVMDVWPTISEVLRSREWMLVESVRTALEAAIDEAEIAASKGEAHPYDVDRMKMLLSMSEIAQTFLRILMRIRMPQSTQGLGRWVTRASSFIKGLGRFT
jgi:HTH-type transcriptional regulator, glycine betaine synthesis regulator